MRGAGAGAYCLSILVYRYFLRALRMSASLSLNTSPTVCLFLYGWYFPSTSYFTNVMTPGLMTLVQAQSVLHLQVYLRSRFSIAISSVISTFPSLSGSGNSGLGAPASDGVPGGAAATNVAGGHAVPVRAERVRLMVFHHFTAAGCGDSAGVGAAWRVLSLSHDTRCQSLERAAGCVPCAPLVTFLS